MLIRCILVLCFFLCLDTVNAQSDIIKQDSAKTTNLDGLKSFQCGPGDPRTHHRLGILIGGVYFDQDPLVIGQVSYFVNAQVELHSSFSVNYTTLGVRYHMNLQKWYARFTPYMGLSIGGTYNYTFAQVPIGLAYIGRKGLYIAAGVGSTLRLFGVDRYNYCEVAMGYRFQY